MVLAKNKGDHNTAFLVQDGTSDIDMPTAFISFQLKGLILLSQTLQLTFKLI